MCDMFGIFGGSDTEETTTQTVTEIPDWVAGPAQSALDIAGNIADQGYTPYQGPRVAGLSPNQQAAIDQASENQGQYSGMINDAINTNNQAGSRTFGGSLDIADFGGSFDFTPQAFGREYSAKMVGDTEAWDQNKAQKYLNPFVNTALKFNLDEQQRRADILRAKISGDAAKSGGYGGSRHGVVESEHDRNVGDQMARTMATELARAYDTAYGQYDTDERRRIGVETTNQGALADEFSLNAAQFNADRARALDAAKFGANYAMDVHSMNADNRARVFDANRDQYNTETDWMFDAAENAADMAVTGSNLDQVGLNNLITTGNMANANEQANLDVAYSDFIEQRDWDTRGLDAYLRALSGTPYPTTTTRTGEVLTQNPSAFGQAAGAGMALYGSGIIGGGGGGGP